MNAMLGIRLSPMAVLLLGAFWVSSAWSGDRVEVTGGTIESTLTSESGVRIFRGIPFAAPPTGTLRWKAPQPVPEWKGVLNADTWGTRCMQGVMFGAPLVTRDQSMGEDCLYLNVWTPATDRDQALPVLVVFHGGGFAAGSASEPRTDGEWMAEQGIVVVEPNYRLGLFGFMAHPELSAESEGRGSGNYGMLDQVAAVEWVRNNIAAFGGDPGRVTVNGESAGSLSVSALMASPLSRHLLHGAIGQSGAFFASPSGNMAEKSLTEKERDGERFAASIGATSLKKLRAVSADELLSAGMAQNNGWGYSPGIDGYFLPESVSSIYAKGAQAKVPLMAGWTSAELGVAIALNPQKPTPTTFPVELRKQFGNRADEAAKVYPATGDQETMRSAAALASDLFITYSTWKWVEVHLKTGNAPVYRYRFDRTLPGDPMSEFGAVHAVDIEYAFNTLDSKAADWEATDRVVASAFANAIVQFVKTGNPNGPGVPDWPEFGDSRQVMYFDDKSRSAKEEFRLRYEFLDSVVNPQ